MATVKMHGPVVCCIQVLPAIKTMPGRPKHGLSASHDNLIKFIQAHCDCVR